MSLEPSSSFHVLATIQLLLLYGDLRRFSLSQAKQKLAKPPLTRLAAEILLQEARSIEADFTAFRKGCLKYVPGAKHERFADKEQFIQRLIQEILPFIAEV